jgi:predicted amidohydrolase YtcJ
MKRGKKNVNKRYPILFFNGNVLTLDGKTRTGEAIIIQDGKVIASGTTINMRGLIKSKAKEVDLHGATLMPGLIDTHPHLLHFFGRTNGLVDLGDAASHSDIVARIRSRAAVTALGEWIVATPVGEQWYFIRRSYRDLAEGELPTRNILDQATPNHPVIIQAWTPVIPNVCALNTLGLARLGITRETPDRMNDVWIEKDASGNPTGILRGSVTTVYNKDPFAIELLKQLPRPQIADFIEGTRKGMLFYNSLGVTTIYEAHNMTPMQIGIYRQLREEKALSVRVLAAPESEIYVNLWDNPLSLDEFKGSLEQALAMVDLSDDLVRVNGVTLSRGGPCWPGFLLMREPYKGPYGEQTKGFTFISLEKAEIAIIFCAERGLRLNIISAGTHEHDETLDLLEVTSKQHDIRDRHWILQHIYFLEPEQARRYAALGFDATTSMSFVWGKGDMFIERIGEHILEHLIPLRRLLDVNMTVGCGTDWGPKNVFEHIELAMTHRFCGSGRTNRGLAQQVTREEALAMWTRDAAKVLKWEDIGTLSPGNHADLIVIDRNPLKCPLSDLPGTRILLTMLGGEAVYSAGEFDV